MLIAALLIQPIAGYGQPPAASPANSALTGSLYVDAPDPADPNACIDTRATAEALLPTLNGATEVGAVVVDYPLEGSVFPPDMCAPMFLWQDNASKASTWLIDVSFESTPHHVFALTDGKRPAPVIDEACIKPDKSNVYAETPWQAAAKGWTPDETVWNLIKANSVNGGARVTIMGYNPQAPAAERRLLSRGLVGLSTSTDSVGAPIFYRDVPLMPSVGVDGAIAPLAKALFPLIKWGLRDISKPTPKVVMSKMDTCANCHSFSRDGHILGMDLDSQQGDKGAYFMASVQPQMVVETKDVFSWNSFGEIPKDNPTFGLFARVSPSGRYAITMVLDGLFAQNYMDYTFLQSFYPTAGILIYYDRETGYIGRLPGADAPDFVQANPFWTPDEKNVLFLRAKSVSPYGSGLRPQAANDPEEPEIRYDLWQVPFNNGQGGEAKPVEGASNNGKSNSMPQVSPDGQWLVYVQCKRGMLMRPDSRLFIVPAQGGHAREMLCNLPLMNSWHSWSPNSRWLVFSSKSNRPFTQMFLTHVDENGNDTPPILIPNSTADNRAVNIPEFVNIPPDGIRDISTPAVDYRRRLAEAVVLRDAGRYEEALKKALESLQLKNTFSQTYFEIGWLLDKVGRTEEAIGYYKQAIALDRNNADAHRNLGYIFYTQELLDKAAFHCAEAVRINPGDALALVNMGNLLFAQKRFDEAIGCYKRMAEAAPEKRHESLNNIGTALVEQGHPEAGADYLRQSIAAKGDYLLARYNLARALSEQGKYKGVIKELKTLLEMDPNYPLAHTRLGRAYFNTGNHGEAAAQYSEALQVNPKDTLALANMGDLFLAQKQYEKAIEYYQKMAGADPGKRHESLNNTGYALVQQGKTDEGIGYFRQSIAAKEDYILARLNLANALSAQGKSGEAVAEFAALLKIDPNHAMAHNNLGYEYSKLGRYEEATAQYAEALRIDPGMRLAQENLANLLKTQPNNARAREVLESARRATGR